MWAASFPKLITHVLCIQILEIKIIYTLLGPWARPHNHLTTQTQALNLQSADSGSNICKVEMFIILDDLSDLKFQLFSSFPISVTWLTDIALNTELTLTEWEWVTKQISWILEFIYLIFLFIKYPLQSLFSL